MKRLVDTLSILLIDDQRLEVKKIQNTLSVLSLNTKLTVVTTPQSALQNISKKKYDLIFCHYMSIDSKGLVFFQKVKKINAWIVVVIITDLKRAAKQQSYIQGRHVHRIDKSLITSAGLEYLIATATHHVNCAYHQQKMLKTKRKIARNTLQEEPFLTNMSHEIRVPMNAIVGFSNLLLKEPLEERQLLYTKAIKQSSEHLLAVVNSMLAFSKAGSGKSKLIKTSFNLSELIKTLETILIPSLNDKNLFLAIDIDNLIPEHLVGHSVYLSQILLNLLNNAIKFTNKGGIYLSVHMKSITSTRMSLLFRVKDTGVGIPKNELKNVFKQFYRVQTENAHATQYAHGTGLGLAICNSLTHLQKGSIGVESILRKGSTFFVEIPFEQRPPLAPTRATKISLKQNDSLLQGKRVLLVEDNAMNKILIEIHLKSWGMLVDIADNGQRAVDKVRKKRYDIILMDIRMPTMNGLNATKTIRSSYSKDQLPIVAMTAHAFSSEQKKCKEAGMNDYMIKPYKVEEVKKLIIKLLQAKRASTSLTPPSTWGKNTTKTVESKKIFHLSALEKLTAGDEKLMTRLMHMYIDAAEVVIKTLPTQYKEKDFLGIASTLHKFLSSAKTFGVKKLYEPISMILDAQDETKIAALNLKVIIPHILYLIQCSQQELIEKLSPCKTGNPTLSCLTKPATVSNK